MSGKGGESGGKSWKVVERGEEEEEIDREVEGKWKKGKQRANFK